MHVGTAGTTFFQAGEEKSYAKILKTLKTPISIGISLSTLCNSVVS